MLGGAGFLPSTVSLIYESMIRLLSLTATAPDVHDLSHGSSSPNGILDFSIFFASENSALSNFQGTKNLRNCQQQHLGKFQKKNDGFLVGCDDFLPRTPLFLGKTPLGFGFTTISHRKPSHCQKSLRRCWPS